MISFNRVLNPQAIDSANWTFRANNNRRQAVGATVVGNEVLANSVMIGADPGPDVVDYSPPPFDVRGFPDLAEVFAFTDFPLDVLP